MQIRILLNDKNAWPSRAYPYDAGLDLKSTEPTFTLQPGEKKLIGTGVHIEIPKLYFGLVVIRSGVGTKTGLELANKVGIIDSDYRGEIKAMMRNNGDTEETIEQYSAIVQLIIVPCIVPEVLVVDKLSDTKRDIGGFGHTTVDNKDPVIREVEALVITSSASALPSLKPAVTVNAST